MKCVIDELYESVLRKVEGQRIARVAIGAGYTYVELDDGGAGVAYTNKEGGISRGLAGRMERMPVEEALTYLLSGRGLEVSFGLATANALVNRPSAELRDRDALLESELSPSDVVVLVGYFPTYINRLKEKVKELYVLEIMEVASKDVEVYPWWAYARLFSKATRLYITGTTISNHTINYILPSSVEIENKYIIGPSTPMIEDPFISYNVKGLSGSLVTNKEACFKIAMQGGGVKDMFKVGCLKKVFLPLEKSTT
jgi:uncharacterized protein (DUF4213/DUF364 family)